MRYFKQIFLSVISFFCLSSISCSKDNASLDKFIEEYKNNNQDYTFLKPGYYQIDSSISDDNGLYTNSFFGEFSSVSFKDTNYLTAVTKKAQVKKTYHDKTFNTDTIEEELFYKDNFLYQSLYDTDSKKTNTFGTNNIYNFTTTINSCNIWCDLAYLFEYLDDKDYQNNNWSIEEKDKEYSLKYNYSYKESDTNNSLEESIIININEYYTITSVLFEQTSISYKDSNSPKPFTVVSKYSLNKVEDKEIVIPTNYQNSYTSNTISNYPESDLIIYKSR